MLFCASIYPKHILLRHLSCYIQRRYVKQPHEQDTILTPLHTQYVLCQALKYKLHNDPGSDESFHWLVCHDHMHDKFEVYP